MENDLILKSAGFPKKTSHETSTYENEWQQWYINQEAQWLVELKAWNDCQYVQKQYGNKQDGKHTWRGLQGIVR